MLICHKRVASNEAAVLQACHVSDVHATMQQGCHTRLFKSRTRLFEVHLDVRNGRLDYGHKPRLFANDIWIILD